MTTLCGDNELGYFTSASGFAPGQDLAFDEAYRTAHLPLVAPHHPLVMATRPGTPYVMGRRPHRFSLVLPVPHDALTRSDAYRALDRELRTTRFAAKIAWDMAERRRDKLHATICGGLAAGEPPAITPPAIGPEARRAMADIGPLIAELRGLFSGNVNIGRLYLRVYPERRDGANAFHLVQRALGCRMTDVYLVGLHNLVDPLDVDDAAALASIIGRWWHRPLARLVIDHLVLLSSGDDLALDSEAVERLPLA
jgi:hypothetical protein